MEMGHEGHETLAVDADLIWHRAPETRLKRRENHPTSKYFKENSFCGEIALLNMLRTTQGVICQV